MNKTYLKTLVILCVLVLLFVSSTVYLFMQNQALTSDPQQTTQDEVTRIVEEVSKLIVLPTDEIPTLATVSDPLALKDQPFFKDAKKGDKVLIYQTAQKAILYDPVAKKVLNVAPLNISGEATETLTTPPAPQEDSLQELQ